VSSGTWIVSNGTGTGGTGTYNVNVSQLVPSTVIGGTFNSILRGGNSNNIRGYIGTACTNQFLTALDNQGFGTCASISGASLASGPTNILGTGTLTSGATGAGFTVNLTASTISGVLAGVNGGTGVANSGKTLTLGGNMTTGSTVSTTGAFSTGGAFTTAGPFSTTGTGAVTEAFPNATVTYIFPTTSGGDTIPGIKTANVFTAPQAVNLSTTAIPTLPGPPQLS
jgi:hypothetical protein